MAKTKISEFSATPANNTDIDSINLAEGCAPSGINDAIRELMAQLKDFQTGAVGDSFNGPVGTTTAAAGAFTTLSATGAITSTLATGSAPLVIASTTKVANLNVDLLDGADWASPAALGSTTPAAVSATTLSASSTLSVTGAGSIQGLTVGRGAGAVSTNTAFGLSALADGSLTGASNTAVGYNALLVSTGAAAQNTAVGSRAMLTNTTGIQNTAIGVNTLRLNTTGATNTGLGMEALYANTTGASSTAVGYGALYSNTTASNNTAVGYQAGYSNTTGAENTSIGGNTLQANTTGSSNTAVGRYALYSNTTSSNSTVVGFRAGYNQTGSGGANTIIGKDAGFALTSGTFNTFVGSTNSSGAGCGEFITTGSKNTIIGGYTGNQGGLDIRTSSNYIVLSDGDGNPRMFSNGSANFFMGATGNLGGVGQARLTVKTTTTGDFAAGFEGYYGVGINALASTGSLMYFYSNGGSTPVGQIYTNGSTTFYATSSDYRLKEKIKPMTGALEKVVALKPCTYTWKSTGVVDEGFIAHELQEVCPSAVIGEKDGVEIYFDKDGVEQTRPQYQRIDTSLLVATLTAAIQEQQAIIESLKARLDAANL